MSVSSAGERACISFFSERAGRWTSLYNSRAAFRDRFHLFMDTVAEQVPPGGKVLDFGCGPGVMSLALAGMGYQVTGVDGAPGMIDVAERERLRQGVENATFAIGGAEGYDCGAARYDAVVCSSVLEYLADDLGTLRRLAAALRPGGVLLVSVPHTASLLGRIEDMAHRMNWLRRGREKVDLEYSIRRYRVKDLVAVLRSCGLQVTGRTFFEVPRLGRAGVLLSRCRWMGIMLLLVARRNGAAVRGEAHRRHTDQCRPKRALSRMRIWESLPVLLRSAVGRMLCIVPRPYVLGREFRRCSRLLADADRWPAQEARGYQVGRLRAICSQADAETVFYRRWFREANFDPHGLNSPEDMATLPTIDREVISTHLHKMCTRRLSHTSVDFITTGGTSGMPLETYMGRERSGIEYAHLVASWSRIGYRLGMPLAVLRGRQVAPDRRGLRHEYDPLLRHHYYSAFHLTDENMGRYLEHIATIGPCFLHVYPSSVAALARFAKRSGAAVPRNIRGIIAESENVYPGQRQLAEEVFGCRYFSCYGHTEKLVLGAECEHSSDYHVWPTYGYCELLDEQGRPVTAPGQRGEIVGTGFINTVMPFIRYRTGDWATYVGEKCEACGREQMILRDIRGHNTQEMLITADGSEIAWTALNMHDDTFLRVRQFQFYQETPGRAVLRVVPATGFGEENRQRILRNLGRKLDGQVAFTIELVDDIPLTLRGKTIYVQQACRNGHDPWCSGSAAGGVDEAAPRQ